MGKRPKNMFQEGNKYQRIFFGGVGMPPLSPGALTFCPICAILGEIKELWEGGEASQPPKKKFSDAYYPPRTCFLGVFPHKPLRTLPSGYCTLLQGHFKPKLGVCARARAFIAEHYFCHFSSLWVISRLPQYHSYLGL